MKNSHFFSSLNRSAITQVFFRVCLSLLALSSSFLRADLNNTVFIVAGGQSNDPFFNITFESNGSVVNFQTYPLRKGNSYTFKGGNISSSHPFSIGSSHNVSSPSVTGGPLDQNSAQNNQSISVTIPTDFQGNLAYYCTIHSSMLKQFIIAEPSSGGVEQPEGLPVYLISQNFVDLFVGENVASSGTYAFEIWTDSSSGTAVENKKLVSAVQDANNDWSREEDSTGNILQYDLVAAYDTFEEIDVILNGFNAQPSGFIIDSEDEDADSENETQPLAIFDLNSTHLYAMTAAQGSAYESNYSIVEELNASNQLEIRFYPMVKSEGNWSRLSEELYFYKNPSIQSMQDVEAYLQSQNLHPVNVEAPQGFPIFELNATTVSQLTIEQVSQAGNYAVVDANQTHVDLEPVHEVANGTWTVTPFNDYVNLVPTIFPDLNATNAWLDANASSPIAYLPFDNDNTDAVDSDFNSTQPSDLNGTHGLPVYTLTQPQVNSLVGANVAYAGTYAVEIWTNTTSGEEYKKLVSAEQINGEWSREVDSTGVIVDLDLVPAYDSFVEVNPYISSQNLTPTGFIIDSEDTGSSSGSETTLSSNGTPVQWARTNGDSDSGVIYDLAQPIKVIAPSGYTVVLKNVAENEEYDTQQTVVDDVHAVLAATGNIDGKGYGGIFYKSDNDTDWAHWTTTYVAYAKAKTTDTEDVGGNLDTEGDANINLPLAIFDLNSTHLFELTGSESAFEGNYSILLIEDGEGETYLTAMPMELVAGQWREDSKGIPYPLDNLLFKAMQDVHSYLQSQNLHPVNVEYPEGFPIFELNDTTVTLLTNGEAKNEGHFAVVDINASFVDLEPVQQDANGSWSITPADDYVNLVPSLFTDFNSLKAWLDDITSDPVAVLPFDDNYPYDIWDGNYSDLGNDQDHEFDFTIINEINLFKPGQLVKFAINHQDIWFQRVNISGEYIWALSVEVNDKNGTMENTDNFIIDLNGSVYKGDFQDYWKQAFGIEYDDNSTNWRENRFDANLDGVEDLYRQYPEVQGPNAQVPPIVRTKSVQSLNGTEAIFSGKIVSNGNNRNLTIGFQFSENIKFENPTEKILKAKPFQISYNFSNHGSKFLYYRAFAKNDKFESFGARKRIKIDLPVQPKIAGAQILEANWESSNWLGNYLAQQNGWIFHEDLGWCFLVVKKKNHWLWMEDQGWTWTTPSVWPYMYRNGSASWIYLLKRKSGPSLLFDRMHGQFMTIQK